MPLCSGLDAPRIIRAMSGEKSRIPIIFITCNTQYEFREFLEVGATAVLSKPIKIPELIQTIQNSLF